MNRPLVYIVIVLEKCENNMTYLFIPKFVNFLNSGANGSIFFYFEIHKAF